MDGRAFNTITKMYDKILNSDTREHLSAHFPDADNFGGKIGHNAIGMISELTEKVANELEKNPKKGQTTIAKSDLFHFCRKVQSKHHVPMKNI